MKKRVIIFERDRCVKRETCSAQSFCFSRPSGWHIISGSSSTDCLTKKKKLTHRFIHSTKMTTRHTLSRSHAQQRRRRRSGSRHSGLRCTMLPLCLLLQLTRLLLFTIASAAQQQQDLTPPPQLNGQHFKITAVQEHGFLDMTDNGMVDGAVVEFSGYLIDMIEAISKRANFSYTLLPPSGTGSACVPRIDIHNPNTITNTTTTTMTYAAKYRTQYNCGAADVNDVVLNNNNGTTTPYSTDFYLGMFYINPTRQLTNKFTIPFLPPFSGTLAMFGTATHLNNFTHLVQQQQEQQELMEMNNTTNPVVADDFVGVQVTAETTCGPAGTALIEEVKGAYPGLTIQGIFGGEDEIYKHFYNGSCTVYITDGPIAAQFILRRSRQAQCEDENDNPIGVIGEPMPFGLSHYAIGIRQDISQEVVNALSYWMLILMSCNPLDENGACPEGNFASFYEGSGGTGEECGYVAYPEQPQDGLNPGIIAGIVFGIFFFVLLVLMALHQYRLRKQRRKFAKENRAAIQKAEKEREFNEFMAHEIRNPLASALAALNFVSSKTADQVVVPDSEQRTLVQSDIRVIDSSLQFINELLRNMLDLHRSSSSTALKLHPVPTDVLRDILEPVASILYMRGASVDIITECNPPNLYVMADRMRLKQILLNLSFNATKFVEKGFIRLRASVVDVKGSSTAMNGENGYVVSGEMHLQQHIELYVEDSGPGIPEHKRKSLFNKWQDSLDVLNQGTGIGLALCEKLSVLMDSDLYLDDNFDSGVPGCPGTGFVLHMRQPPLGVEGSVSLPDSLGGSIRQIYNGKTMDTRDSSFSITDRIREELPQNLSVLFVDDDAMLRKMFGRVLKSVVGPTWSIREASNGETALRIVDEDQFDLIFVDQYMASVEKQLLGTETVAAMRSKGVTSIICGLSANDVEDQYMKAGANYFLYKPFPCKADALRDELRQMLASYEVDEEKAPM